MKKFLFLIVTLLLVVSGCTEKEIKLTENANITKAIWNRAVIKLFPLRERVVRNLKERIYLLP